MNINEAFEILGIEEYADRIFNSNSHGELFHLLQYFTLAEWVGNDLDTKKWFQEWFKGNVEYAEKNWKRPESIFQHIHKLLQDQLKQEMIKRNLKP